MNDLFIVSETEGDLRLDKLLAAHFPDHSRSYFAYLIDEGCVLVNGVPLKKREKPQAGDEIEVCFLLTPEISLKPEAIPLEILYEDEHLIGVNKPSGMVVHPAPGHPSGTFVNALLHHCCELPVNDLRPGALFPLTGRISAERETPDAATFDESIAEGTMDEEKGAADRRFAASRKLAENVNKARPGIVHRLDKETSGVLLAAKTQEAHHKLVRLFAERRIQKTYLAVVVGHPKEGWIDAPIKRHPVNRKEMSVCFEGGREAKSLCRILAQDKRLSLIEVEPITGRTHQIRVHLKYRGTPVLGDSLYGSVSVNREFGVERQLLHALKVAFPHPITGAMIEIKAPLPLDFLMVSSKFSL